MQFALFWRLQDSISTEKRDIHRSAMALICGHCLVDIIPARKKVEKGPSGAGHFR